MESQPLNVCLCAYEEHGIQRVKKPETQLRSCSDAPTNSPQHEGKTNTFEIQRKPLHCLLDFSFKRISWFHITAVALFFFISVAYTSLEDLDRLVV